MTTTADRAAAAPPEEFAVESAAPRWPRPALAALLAVTAALYLWKLSASGYGNAFYAAAAQAGAQSWKAWFFGSLDAGNFVTVDKPPAATWVTGLSVRLFGMNPWAVLAPQALIGVGTVAALFATVRRAVSDPRLGAAAGLLAGATLAVTPAAVLIFRYNNPDALMVLLMVLGAYCVTRATRTASWRWLALAGVALGFAFLTKMFAGVMVLPGFVLSYLLFAPTSVRKRLSHLLLAGAGLLVSAGWWVLIVELWPDDARPYISNSTDNSVLNLALGYNGVSRILGRNNTPHVTEDARNPLHYGTFSSSPGLHRLFTGEMGYEISWFLPAALFVIAFAVYLWRGAALSRDEKAAAVMWTSWIMLCGTMFTYMDGMVHPYYTVAMAPAVGAVVGLGGVWAWRYRSRRSGVAASAAMIALAAGWSGWLLHRAGLGPTWPRWAIGLLAVAAVVMIGSRWARPALAAGLIAGIAGVTAFGIAAANTPHDGAIPNAVHTAGGWPTAGNRFGRPAFQMGNLQTNKALAAELRATHTRWSAATAGSQAAAALEISSGTSVMAIGGWSKDPVPTVGDFIDDVRAGRITYYIDSGRGSRSPYGHEIAAWVARNYHSTDVGGTKVFRLA